MSIQTWRDEFYNVHAIQSIRNPVAHSLKKWSGTTAVNLAKHGLTRQDFTLKDSEETTFCLSAFTCALCLMDIRLCVGCPIPKVAPACGDTDSPYAAFVETGDPAQMLRVLEKCLPFDALCRTASPVLEDRCIFSKMHIVDIEGENLALAREDRRKELRPVLRSVEFHDHHLIPVPEEDLGKTCGLEFEYKGKVYTMVVDDGTGIWSVAGMILDLGAVFDNLLVPLVDMNGNPIEVPVPIPIRSSHSAQISLF